MFTNVGGDGSSSKRGKIIGVGDYRSKKGIPKFLKWKGRKGH